MDSCYTQMTALPVDMPEYQAFMKDMNLPNHKLVELLLLLDQVSHDSATHAVRYCTRMIENKQIADATEDWYQSILDESSMRRKQHTEDVYLALYLRLRKQFMSLLQIARERIYP